MLMKICLFPLSGLIYDHLLSLSHILHRGNLYYRIILDAFNPYLSASQKYFWDELGSRSIYGILIGLMNLKYIEVAIEVNAKTITAKSFGLSLSSLR